jgi:hypothetical protein
MDRNLEAKLQEIVDRHEIWTLLLRFARGLDRMDREMVRSCYWDDAVEDHYTFIGTPDGFIDWTFAYMESSNSVQHHGITNHFCEIDGDDAQSETYYSFIGVNLEPPHVLSVGRYVDHFQRREGIWKNANRVTMVEKNFALDASPDDALLTHPQSTCGPLLPVARDRSDFSYTRPIVPRKPPA